MTRHIEYALMDPTGNITLLAETPVPEPLQPAVAGLLTEREPETEQVGFVTCGDGLLVDLRMAGGEFCGNAAMSTAVLCAERLGIEAGDIAVRVAGTPQPVTVRAHRRSENEWQASVAMPLPVAAEQMHFPDGSIHPVVRFDGIAHVLLDETPDREWAEAAAPLWCRSLRAEALGLMFLDRAAGTMSPLVYVPAAGTLCWESSCASGTTAAGVWLAMSASEPVTVSLRQPGGALEIAAAPGEAPVLTGVVRLRKRGSAALSL